VLHTRYFKQASFLRYPVSLAQNIKQSTLAVFKSFFFFYHLFSSYQTDENVFCPGWMVYCCELLIWEYIGPQPIIFQTEIFQPIILCQHLWNVVLQGSVAITGAAVKWLRDNLNLISKASEIGKIDKCCHIKVVYSIKWTLYFSLCKDS